MTHDEEQGRYVASHHPFTAPVPEDLQYLDPTQSAARVSTTTSCSTAWN